MLENLEHLGLGSNDITNISDFIFKGLGKLRFLDLSCYKISQFTKNTFFGLHDIEILSRELNSLLHIEASALIQLTSLKNIDLRDIHHPASQWEVYDFKSDAHIWCLPFGIDAQEHYLLF